MMTGTLDSVAGKKTVWEGSAQQPQASAESVESHLLHCLSTNCGTKILKHTQTSKVSMLHIESIFKLCWFISMYLLT